MKDHRRTDVVLVTSQLSYGALVGDFAVQGTWYLAVLGISEHSFIAAVLRYRVFDTQRNFVIYLHARHVRALKLVRALMNRNLVGFQIAGQIFSFSARLEDVLR